MQIIKEAAFLDSCLTEDQSSFEFEKTTPYMLRNDGVLLKCGEVHPYIKVFYNADWETNLAELNKHPHWIDWYKKNSREAHIVELFDQLKQNPTEELYTKINDILNNEFCKVRTTNIKYKYGSDNGEIYFRICGTNVNWYDIIWKVLMHSPSDIKFVTVVRDYQTFGKQFDYCKYKQHVFNKMPIQEFLTLEGNPILENLNNKIYLWEL